MPFLGEPLARRVPRTWFRIPERERIIHRLLGVRVFGHILERTGWNSLVVGAGRTFNGTRAALPRLAQSLRGNMSAHAAGLALHLGLAGGTVATGRPSSALWLALPGIVLHLYPVLLQRSIFLRTQHLSDRYDR
ncbi:glycosyl-4,4'-diaponeurosporenoate acyltransferase CrtO family protein [Nesterenkonia flava]|uniref:glycosyl-4,4'-diaponeurosporenoate acyltransferase CrtO family protein n=1 Tax=Nesterenkonia flava TaxID=469799 RepID=UPI0035B66042